jgi:outer membrane lipoprotein-sorting protein
MNHLMVFVVTINLVFGLPTFLNAENPKTAQEIIAASDAVRNPDKPFSLKTTLVEYRGGREQERMILIVYSKEEKSSGQYRSLIRFIEPPRDENKLMLKDGNILWFFDPASKASVRISPRQRLMGQASNGDVVTVNFSKDYKATLEGEETITDAEKNNRNCYKVNLVAANDTVTYYRIEYWVEKETDQPVKGKFYSESDRLLKIVYYRNYREELGKRRPTETIIIDGVDSKLITRMNYSDYNFRDIPEEWFQKEYLPRFKSN